MARDSSARKRFLADADHSDRASDLLYVSSYYLSGFSANFKLFGIEKNKNILLHPISVLLDIIIYLFVDGLSADFNNISR